MNLRFYIDPATDQPHIYEHGVDEDEVEDVLLNPSEDHPGRNGSRIAIGQTRSGRYLRVIYVPDPQADSVFIVTAYMIKGKVLLAHRRRRRKRLKRR